jgi:hypothetical protein
MVSSSGCPEVLEDKIAWNCGETAKVASTKRMLSFGVSGLGDIYAIKIFFSPLRGNSEQFYIRFIESVNYYDQRYL